MDTGANSQTGGRLKHIKPWLGDDEHFRATYGDGVADINIKTLLEFHHQHDKKATMTMVRPPSRFGDVMTEGDHISHFNEKPQTGEGWINGDYFVMHRDILDEVDDQNTVRQLTQPISPSIASLPASSVLFLSDALVGLAAFMMVNWLQRGVVSAQLEWEQLTVFGGVWLIVRAYRNFYPGYGQSPQTELKIHVTTTFSAALIHLATTFAVHELDKSRLLLFVIWTVLMLVALPLRWMVRSSLIRMNAFGRPVVILGAAKTGEMTVDYLVKNPSYGLKPVAIYDDNLELWGGKLCGVPIRGNFELALEERLTSQVILCIPGASGERKSEMMNAVHSVFPITWATPDLFGTPNQAFVPHNIGSHAALEVRNNLFSRRAQFIKRAMDLSLTVFGGLLISPILILVAMAVGLDSRGPIVYKSWRLGKDGKTFACLKFRSMYADADARLNELLDSDPALRAEFEATHKLRKDPRVTRVGAFLRKTSLDELPQLLNVLVGEMSLVGPRPIVQTEVVKYADVYQTYKQVRPGMTGYWQVSGRSDTSYDERVNMDYFYVTNWTPWLDFIVLIQTVRVVLMSKGAY